MSPTGERDDDRELALGLVGALAPALSDVAAPESVGGARAAAQGLELAGLERLLAVCAPHAGSAWPAEVAPALDRVRRLAAQAVEAGSLAPFREADRELAGLAEEISALYWSPSSLTASGDAPPVATLSLADALDELGLGDDASRDIARRVRLLPPVAAALRAALDWLTSESGRPLSLRAQDSVLEVSCERVDFGALDAATEVLAAVGANLGPGPGPVGTWTIRVPLHAGREVFLMLVHGGVPIAIPWHAVLRLHMTGVSGTADRESLGGWPVLTGPLGSQAPAAGELPLALIAHGRKRAWLVADRLIWRLHAEPVAPTERSPVAGLFTMVETEEGEHYWLADPAWLLQSMEAPTLVKSAARPAPAVASTPAATPTPARAPEARQVSVPEPVAAPEPAPAPALAPAAPAAHAPHLRLLTAEDVERLEATGVADFAPAAPAYQLPVSAPPSPAPSRPLDSARGASVRPAPAPPAFETAAAGRRAVRSALVAEDSITARIFLARLLARLGFEVHTVDTAAALRAELERGSWALVCVDIELPDESGTAFLAGLIERHGGRSPFIALVRDAEDRAAARQAGIGRMLRKPFDHLELEQVLGRLGLIPRRP